MSSWGTADGYLAGLLRSSIARELTAAACNGCEVLDIGSGSQPYGNLVEGHGARYVPCDLGPGPHTEIKPGGKLPFERHRFAFGLSIQVLEHVWDLDWYLGLYREHLRVDGQLILSTHGTWPYHPHPTDFRRWTRDGLRKELETRGFQVERIIGLMGPLAWTTQIRLSGLSQLGRKVRFPEFALRPLFMIGNAWMWIEDRLTPSEMTAENACVYFVVCRPAAGNGRTTSANET